MMTKRHKITTKRPNYHRETHNSHKKHNNKKTQIGYKMTHDHCRHSYPPRYTNDCKDTQMPAKTYKATTKESKSPKRHNNHKHRDKVTTE